MSGREQVLGKIRRSLAVSPDDRERRAKVASRMKLATPHLIPARGRLPAPQRLDLFCDQAEAVMASVTRVPDRDAVPGAIASYLREHNLPAKIRSGSDPRLAQMPWGDQPHLERDMGASDGSDAVGVSHGYAGVAETGSLILVSGCDNPTTLNFLPDTHIVVVDAADIAGDYEAVWGRLRRQFGKGEMPRTVNLITGPSRSADIEQTLILGAHGPRALHIVVVEGP